MNWIVIAAVAIGGALGSVLRYSLASLIQPSWWPGFPFGIFTVNITGGLVMGLITELAALKFSMTLEVRAFLTTGILGGYTTFSTASFETVRLIQTGHLRAAWINLVGTLGGALLAGAAGLAVATI